MFDLSRETSLPYSLDYPPPDFVDPVIEVYKRDVDRSIIRENLKLTVEERLRKHQNAQAFFEELRRAGQDPVKRHGSQRVTSDVDVVYSSQSHECVRAVMNERELLQRITINPQIFGGKPILRGRRLAVEHVLGMLAAGDSPDTILEGYSWLEREDIQACLVYAQRHVGHERIEPLEVLAGTSP